MKTTTYLLLAATSLSIAFSTPAAAESAPAKKEGLFAKMWPFDGKDEKEATKGATTDQPKAEGGFMKKLWPFGDKPVPTKEAAPPTKPAKPVQKPKELEKPVAKKSGIIGKLWPFGGGEDLTKKVPAKPESKKEGLMAKIWPFGGKKEATADKVAPTTIVKTKSNLAKTTPTTSKEEAKPEFVETPKKKGFFSGWFDPIPSSNNTSDNSVAEINKIVRPEDWETKALITEDETAAYLIGPAQASADERLAKGTLVTMKNRGKHWTEVTLADGRTMTIGSDQVRMAKSDDFLDPPPPVVAANPALPQFAPLTMDPQEAQLPQFDPTGPVSSGELLLIPAQP